MFNGEARYARNVRVINAIALRTSSELALGYLRYEALRNLNARELGDLHKRNMSGENFDDLVDELIVKGAK